MNNTVLSIIRISITAVITGLSAALAYYPHELWIPATIAALGAIGVHVIPSVNQPSTSGTVIVNTPPVSKPPFTGD